VVGLRLPEEEDEQVPPTRWESLKRKLAGIWAQVAGI
jgi:potassium/hydrogen antiporter